MNIWRRIVRASLATYLRTGVSMVVFFFLTPFVMARLGVDDYGLWVLAFSLVGFLRLLDLGLGTGVVKFVADSDGRRDPEERNRILSSSIAVYLLIGALAAGLVALLAPVLPGALDIDAGQARKTETLLWLVALRVVVLGVPLSVFRGILFGKQRIAVLNAVQTLATLLYAGSTWLLLTRGGGVVALAAVNLAVMLVEHAAYAVLAFRLVPDLRLSPALVNARSMRRIASFSAFAFVSTAAWMILMRADPLVVKLHLPLAAVAIYGVALKVTERLSMLVKQFVNLLTPVIAERHGAGARAGVRDLLRDGTRYAFAIGTMLCVPVLLLARDLLTAWLGPEFGEAGVVLALLAAALLVSVPQMMASNVLAMSAWPWFAAAAAAAGVGVNLGVSILLVRPLGLAGVALGTLIAVLLIDVLVVVPRALAAHALSGRAYLREAIVPSAVAGAAQAAVTAVGQILVDPQGLFAIALVAAPGVVAFAAIYAGLFLRPEERDAMRGLIRGNNGRRGHANRRTTHENARRSE